MNRQNKIANIVLLIPFLFSSIGMVIVNHECSCSGVTKVSLYFAPDKCGEKYFRMPSANSSSSKQINATDDCSLCDRTGTTGNCSDFTVKFLKTKNHLANDELKIAKLQASQIVITTILIHDYPEDGLHSSNTDYFYIDPPNSITSLDFLVEINQLKIPNIA